METSIEQVRDDLKKYNVDLSHYRLTSDDGRQLKPGDKLIFGYMYDKDTLREVTIKSVDGRGVIRTDNGNFSTKYHHVSSTVKQVINFRGVEESLVFSMFSYDKIAEILEDRKAKSAASVRRGKYLELLNEIRKLEPNSCTSYNSSYEQTPDEISKEQIIDQLLKLLNNSKNFPE
jgi:hydroxymethylpyrimidine pyrophosphatase-like HAD family hydrolase